MKYSSLESEYLMTLIRAAIKEDSVPNVPQGVDFEALIELSKSQQVYSIIANYMNIDKLPKTLGEEITKSLQSELLRILSMQTELQELEKQLKEKQIKFMLLKGSVLRNYYPKQKMRQMSDYDILYDYSKRDDLVRIMKKRGFRLTTSCENTDDFFKEPFYTFEWHRELFFEESDFCPHFDLWKNAKQDTENPYKYIVEPNEHFVYTVCHMYKHYATRGCGVRFLCDIYLMIKKESLDFDYCEKRLEEIGILDFYKDALELTCAVFDDKPFGENAEKMINFMLSNGIYGNSVVDYSKRIKEYNGSRLGYLLRRIFPSKKQMIANYRILEKKPYLLPVYYIVRLFSKVKYNSGSAKNELSALKNTKKD